MPHSFCQSSVKEKWTSSCHFLTRQTVLKCCGLYKSRKLICLTFENVLCKKNNFKYCSLHRAFYLTWKKRSERVILSLFLNAQPKSRRMHLLRIQNIVFLVQCCSRPLIRGRVSQDTGCHLTTRKGSWFFILYS